MKETREEIMKARTFNDIGVAINLPPILVQAQKMMNDIQQMPKEILKENLAHNIALQEASHEEKKKGRASLKKVEAGP